MVPTLDDFFARRRSANLPFVSDDAIRMKEGKRTGAIAAVICLESSDPVLTFQIEYSDGVLDVVEAKHMELLPESA